MVFIKAIQVRIILSRPFININLFLLFSQLVQDLLQASRNDHLSL